MPHATHGHSYNQAAGVHVRCSGPVSYLGSLVDELVESRVYIIGKLDLSNRLHAFQSGTYSKAHDPLLAQRGIENSLRAKIVGQAHGASEDAAKGHVLAEDKHAIIGGEGVSQGRVDGLKEILAGGFGVAHMLGQFWV